MIEFKFAEKSEVAAKHVLFANYIARYIFNGTQTFARIVFSTYGNLENTLDQYARLHTANQKLFAQKVDDFYKNVLEDFGKIKVFEKEFYAHLTRKLRVIYLKERRPYDKIKIDSLWYNKTKCTLEVGTEGNQAELDFLNDKGLQAAKDTAKIFFKYEGEIIFDESIVF